jgi:hypothetical protein
VRSRQAVRSAPNSRPTSAERRQPSPGLPPRCFRCALKNVYYLAQPMRPQGQPAPSATGRPPPRQGPPAPRGGPRRRHRVRRQLRRGRRGGGGGAMLRVAARPLGQPRSSAQPRTRRQVMRVGSQALTAQCRGAAGTSRAGRRRARTRSACGDVGARAGWADCLRGCCAAARGWDGGNFGH